MLYISDILFNRIGSVIRWMIHILLFKNVSYKFLLNGIAHPKTKRDEEYNIKDEITNRLYGVGFWIIVLIVLCVIGVI